jgi:hypothetical protein
VNKKSKPVAHWTNIRLDFNNPDNLSTEEIARINRRLRQEEVPPGSDLASIQLGDYDFPGIKILHDKPGISTRWRSPLLPLKTLQAILHKLGHPNYAAEFDDDQPCPAFFNSEFCHLTEEQLTNVRKLFPEYFPIIDPFDL